LSSLTLNLPTLHTFDRLPYGCLLFLYRLELELELELELRNETTCMRVE